MAHESITSQSECAAGNCTTAIIEAWSPVDDGCRPDSLSGFTGAKNFFSELWISVGAYGAFRTNSGG